MKSRFFRISFLVGILVICSGCATSGSGAVAGYFWDGKVPVNGVDQYVQVRGRSPLQPLVLILHGGPGWAIDSLTRPILKDLEKDFLVVDWHQRGAGQSYGEDLDSGSMTLGQFLMDTEAVIRFLLDRYDQEKLILVGHSWGTVLGAITTHNHPEWVRGYVGVSQLSNTRRALALCEEKAEALAGRRGLMIKRRKISRIDPDPRRNTDWLNDVVSFRRLITRLGGTFGQMATFIPIAQYYLHDPLFKFSEQLNVVRGMDYSVEHLYPQMLEADLFRSAAEFSVPVVFIQGKYDLMVVPESSRDYFEAVKAPQKEYYLFEESAHCPFLEEPERFMEILRTLASNLKEPVL